MGNSPVTSEFPAQRPSNEENVSIWWHHPVKIEMAQVIVIIPQGRQGRTCLSKIVNIDDCWWSDTLWHQGIRSHDTKFSWNIPSSAGKELTSLNDGSQADSLHKRPVTWKSFSLFFIVMKRTVASISVWQKKLKSPISKFYEKHSNYWEDFLRHWPHINFLIKCKPSNLGPMSSKHWKPSVVMLPTLS